LENERVTSLLKENNLGKNSAEIELSGGVKKRRTQQKPKGGGKS